MTERIKKEPWTAEQLVIELEKLFAIDPENRKKLLLTTAGCGYVHERVHGIDRVDEEDIVLGEAD